MYSCASRLGELKQKIYPFIDNGTVTQYAEFKTQYHEILKLYETAAINDFRADYIRAQLDMPENYNFGGIKKLTLHVKVFLMYFLNYMQYLVVLAVFSSLLYWLWLGPKAAQ
jgi:hypothetical protein